MSEMQDQWQAPFDRQTMKMAILAQEAMLKGVAARETTTRWPEEREHIESGVIPTLNGWLATMRGLLKPVSLWRLQRAHFRLLLWHVILWVHPQVMRARLGNVVLRLRIVGRYIWIYRVQILLIIAALVLVAVIGWVVTWLMQNWQMLISALQQGLDPLFGRGAP